MSIKISTGNVLHTREPQRIQSADVEQDLKSTIQLWKTQQAQKIQSETLDDVVGPADHFDISIPYDEAMARVSACKPEGELIVKLFLPPVDNGKSRKGAIKEALESLRREKHAEHKIASLVLSFPEIVFSDNDILEDDEILEGLQSNVDKREDSVLTIEFFEIWIEAAAIAPQYGVESLGVAEFSISRLNALLQFCRIHNYSPPVTNQINTRDCCVLPPSLINLAKENNVKLIAHNDDIDILPDTVLQDCVSMIIPTSTAKNEKWTWDWLLKVTCIVSDRSIVCGQGWITKLTLHS
ncbi:hypothetical protein V1511DRAFT_500232 [Dipodascopsis uninucleata]